MASPFYFYEDTMGKIKAIRFWRSFMPKVNVTNTLDDIDIRLIDKDTDLSATNFWHLDWDVVVNDKPYYVVRIPGYVHTIGGKWGINDYWAYPRDEDPTVENLIEYNGDCGACWGFRFEPRNYIRSKWGETEACSLAPVTITRNGKDFYKTYGIDNARVLIEELNEHPLCFNEIDFDKKMIGRKVWWRSEPAVITKWIAGQACVILEPDGIDNFTVPPEFGKDDPMYYEDGDVKTTVFDEHVWWFRD